MQSLEIISVNIWSILVSLANLLIMFLILKRFLFKPVQKMMAARKQQVDQIYQDAKENRVYITKTPQKGSKTCITFYKTLQSRNGLSLVECELVTGRTHQIRAQMAAAGWPLLGDGKYGKLDKRYDRKFQALYSYKLTFCFKTDAGILSYLDGKTFQVASVDFVQEYFT